MVEMEDSFELEWFSITFMLMAIHLKILVDSEWA